jgi:DNA-binding response OmpR family regulator
VLKHMQIYYIEMVTMDKKVLLINNTGAVSSISGLLAAYGYEADVVSGPEKGLRRLYGRNYNLVIVLEYFTAESWRLCEKIRELTGIPLIVISANAGTEACVKAINAGADYFMRKPFGSLELLARIDSLYQRSLPRQAATVVP